MDTPSGLGWDRHDSVGDRRLVVVHFPSPGNSTEVETDETTLEENGDLPCSCNVRRTRGP